jgi:hypothetical protein
VKIKPVIPVILIGYHLGPFMFTPYVEYGIIFSVVGAGISLCADDFIGPWTGSTLVNYQIAKNYD